MSRISSVFNDKKHKALITYLTVGYPSIEATLEVVPNLAKWGCDIVELGIPFSEPLADGITIQKSTYHALSNGVTPKLSLEVANKLREKVDIPLMFMTYYNLIFSFGEERFCQESAAAGVDGIIIPDLPPEEGKNLKHAAAGYGLDLVYLLAPTSNEERIALVSQQSSGFIYLVSLTGVTGARDALPTYMENFVQKVREKTSL